MMKGHANISVYQGACIISGLSIGSGVMAVPHFFVQNYWVIALVMIALAWMLCAMLNLMIAETAMRSNKDYQIVELFQEYLFPNAPSWVMWLVFITTIINFYLSLLTFSVAATEILTDLLQLPLMVTYGLVFCITAIPILFGLRTMAVSDTMAISIILVIISVMTIMSVKNASVPLRDDIGDLKSMLGLYSMASLAFIGIVSVPQLVTGLGDRQRHVPKAIFLGLGINAFLIISIAIGVSITATDVTEVAIIGWSEALGSTTHILGSLFVLLAIVTSYWGTAYGAAIIYQQRMSISYVSSWIWVVVPTLLMMLFINVGFIELMQASAGLLAVMLIFSIVPMYRASVKRTPNYKGYTLGVLGKNIGQIIVVIGFLLVVVGSIL